MNEHDSLVSHALNNMTLNELANAYADLKMKLREICNHDCGFLGSIGESFCQRCGARKK